MPTADDKHREFNEWARRNPYEGGQDERTLEQALRETAQAKWQGRRCYATNMSQATTAALAVGCASGERRGLRPGQPGALHATVSQVTPQDIKAATSLWYSLGLAPATINKRLNCLSAMGVSVEGCRVREPKVLKWWLKPEDEDTVCRWLRASYRTPDCLAADLIQWTTRTGMRIEETLRLTWADFEGIGGIGAMAVLVPGTKTWSAQASLPLGAEAAAIIRGLSADYPDCDSKGPWSLLSYEKLLAIWDAVRKEYGWQDNPTATLKALRRSAARHLHITKGMPLDMVRQYLRHEDIETTMGYLRLTGGYGTEEMRKWL